MRILIDYRPALRNRTGVGEYFHQLLRAFANLGGHEVYAFSSSWRDRVGSPPAPGVQVIDRRIPVRLLNLLWHRLEWPPIEVLTRRDYDVAHSPHPLLLPARRAAQVVTVHDLDFLRHPERTRAEIRRDYPALARLHAGRADAVIVPSAATRQDVIELLGATPDKVCVCPPGAPAWTPRDHQPDAGSILFLGSIEPRKNIEGLVQAYERLRTRVPDAPDLVIAGKSVNIPESTTRILARASQGGGVRLLGYVPEEKRRELIGSATMLVLPSHDEGFGLPVLEAMTAGVPVVVSNRGALPAVVGDAGLQVDPDSTDAIADAMERLLTEPGLAARLGAAGAARAQAFSWATTARTALDIYGLAVRNRTARQASV